MSIAFDLLYGRFLSARMVTAKPIVIATIIATAATAMYIPVGGWAATGCSVAVAAGALTVKWVSALDE